MSKKVPNPYGKKGSPEHRKKIAEVAKDAEKKGKIAFIEFLIRKIKGRKIGIYADVACFNKETGELEEVHQVGKANKNGTPVSRERKVIEEIKNNKKGEKTKFHAYNVLIIMLLFCSFLLFLYYN